MRKKIKFIILILLFVLGIATVVSNAANTTPDNSQAYVTSEETTNEVATQNNDNSKGLGLIAVALSTGLACVGAGIAVAVVASSAVGAISENPKLLGKTIIFAGLAEGIAIYGLIISIMILNKI